MGQNNFLEKKQYFKERQILYEKMKSVTENKMPKSVVEIDGKFWQETSNEFATHIFIWFDRKPMICAYSSIHKAYFIGNQKCNISNPHKKSNRVIAFVTNVTDCFN